MKRNLLIVEDNELNREILAAMLEDEFQLFFAENGQEGMEQMRMHATELSLVLLDIQMPVMNGYEVLEAVAADPQLREIPVVVTTGSDRLDEEERCLRLGATDFIQKPYNPNIVSCRINNIIRLQEKTAILTEVEIDPMTGIYTRSAFNHYAAELLKNHPDVDYSLVITDVVNFSRYVESYGDQAFEILRKEVALIEKRISIDCICGRDSFDQIVALLPTVNASLSDEVKLERYDHFCHKVSDLIGANIKIGVCEHVDHSQPIAVAINRAKKALATVKHLYGKRAALVNNALLDRIQRAEAIELAMEDAIKQRQLELYFQPKHHTASGKLLGAEVLLRWQHPTLGFISSGEFVPIFERTGFIVEADAYAWREACAFIKNLERKQLPVCPLSVNTTRYDYLRPGFKEQILQPMRDMEIGPELMHIEVTEQLFAELGNDAIAIMNDFRKFGIHVELDDFGTGYSSLHSLAELPIDVVKFDQSFVRKLNDKRQLEVMTGCVNLVKRLGLLSIAEGVEDEVTRQTIADLNIDLIQGYYYARPMCASDYEEYIRTHEVMSKEEYESFRKDPHVEELERLRRLAEEDPLTGLSNRYRLLNNINARLRDKHPFSIVLLDIDKFKAINDTRGHLIGDRVLIAVANQMKADFAQCDLIRLGGDEFAIIFDGVVGYHEMMSQMNAFFNHVQDLRIEGLDDETNKRSQGRTKIALSAGCVCYHGDADTTFETLYFQADKLLYVSKHTSGCCLNYAGNSHTLYL